MPEVLLLKEKSLLLPYFWHVYTFWNVLYDTFNKISQYEIVDWKILCQNIQELKIPLPFRVMLARVPKSYT